MTISRLVVPMLALVASAAALAAFAVPHNRADGAPIVAAAPEHEFAELQKAADSFLASLSPSQRAKTVFAFEDSERLNWHFVPRPRRGLSLKDMSAQQRELARGMLRALDVAG